jgi:hypothetical protein
MIPVPLSDLIERAKERPPGYLEEALSMAVSVDDSEAVFTDEAFQALVGKYSPGKPPGLVQMAANIATATGRWATAGFPKTPAKALEIRQVTCAGGMLDGKEVAQCIHFLPEGLIRKCALCGCNGLKLTWATESCPARKWDAVQPLGN